MSRTLVECVPNISEGRDAAKIKQVTDAIAAVPGVRLLDVDPGADTNRTVITFVGEPEAVLAGAFACIAEAAKVIDMRQQHGAHPRMGATDVVPFVPVEGVSMADCAELARRLGPCARRRIAARILLGRALRGGGCVSLSPLRDRPGRRGRRGRRQRVGLRCGSRGRRRRRSPAWRDPTAGSRSRWPDRTRP